MCIHKDMCVYRQGCTCIQSMIYMYVDNDMHIYRPLYTCIETSMYTDKDIHDYREGNTYI